MPYGVLGAIVLGAISTWVQILFDRECGITVNMWSGQSITRPKNSNSLFFCLSSGMALVLALIAIVLDKPSQIRLLLLGVLFFIALSTFFASAWFTKALITRAFIVAVVALVLTNLYPSIQQFLIAKIPKAPVEHRPTPSESAAPTAPTPRPYLDLSFLGSEEPTLVLSNMSKATIRDVIYNFLLTDIDHPNVRRSPSGQPIITFIPILTKKVDYINPGEEHSVRILVFPENIAATLVVGDRIFGMVIAQCPECLDARVWLYYEFGRYGWYRRTASSKGPLPADLLADPERVINMFVPPTERRVIR